MVDLKRSDIIGEVIAKRITGEKAAKLMGISRVRVHQLAKREKEKREKAAAGGQTFATMPPPPPADPLAAVFPDTPPPANIKDVLAPVGLPTDVPVPPGPLPPPPPTDKTQTIQDIDAEDVEAGRELFKLLRVSLGKFAAKAVYELKDDDPRLNKFEEDNAFLKLAWKRNADKAAPVGRLTKGIKGILIGLAVEVIRVVKEFGLPKEKAEEKAPPLAPEPVPPPAPEIDPSTIPTATQRKSLAEKAAEFARSKGIPL